MKRALLLVAVALLAIPAKAGAAQEKKEIRQDRREAVAALPEKYRAWVEEVDVLLTEEEKDAFLALTQDYQRDAFIKRFWDQRDKTKSTGRNEFREAWEQRVLDARQKLGDLTDARARIYLLNGPPGEILDSADCRLLLVPLEIWIYPPNDKIRTMYIVILYQKWGGGPWRIWVPYYEGTEVFRAQGVGEARGNGAEAPRGGTGLGGGRVDDGSSGGGSVIEALRNPLGGCGQGDKGERMAKAMIYLQSYPALEWEHLDAKTSKPEPVGTEWVSTFASYSTDIPEGALPLPASLEVSYPGRYRSRTMLQGVASVPAAEAAQAKLGEHGSYNLLLNGDILQQNGDLFESFRVKFDFPASEAPEELPLVFQRPLRPGEYTLVVKIEDVNSGKVFRDERRISVPAVENALPVAVPASEVDAETARLLAEANATLATGETTIKLVPPAGHLQTGMVRFDTLTTGDVEKVTFTLDGKPVLTKKSPPWSVELDLGAAPRTRTLAVIAFDASGVAVATDDLVVNSAGHRFRVRILEPIKGKRYNGSLLARVEAEAPEGQTVERVELFLNETRVATLYQPPYVHPVFLPKAEEISYVRAVAYLADGNSTESLVFVNAPENLGEIDIDFVELYATGLDRKGRPVAGLTKKDFAVKEDGVRQEIVRFERVTDLPVHVALMVDVSASMEPALAKAQEAALRFLEGSLQPRDRAAVVTFNDHPFLAVKFTNDVPSLAGGLAGVKAERGTSLYDSLIFTLYYFNGIKGQRAILLLSDGKDEGSRFTWEDALETARRAGVALYPLGLGEKIDKKKLEKLAEETGGRAFFLKSADELAGIYAAVEEELRSKYLLAYQSTNTTGSTGFRTVDLTVSRPGVEVKTMRGYYP
ncbi:MAG TPA: VWA domain-containing protein [Thermoanaerobaculia bacterium]|nr:VWA domain-containing protein [Thermoanaerobaculia bacterium]